MVSIHKAKVLLISTDEKVAGEQGEKCLKCGYSVTNAANYQYGYLKLIKDESIEIILLTSDAYYGDDGAGLFWTHVLSKSIPVILILESDEGLDLEQFKNFGHCTFLDASASLLTLEGSFEMALKLSRLSNYLLNSNRKLEKSEAMLKSMLNGIPDPVWIKDPNGYYLSCNQRFCQLFGTTERNIVGKTDYDFVSKEVAEFFIMNDRAAIKRGLPTMNEETLVFANDGHTETVETVKTPVYDYDGNLVGILGIARDITERKAVEEALLRLNETLEKRVQERTNKLRKMTERLMLATKSGRIGAWDWDVTSNEIWWDPMLFELYGLEDRMGENTLELFQEIIHPDDREMTFKRFEEAIDEEGEYTVEFRCIRPDNELRYFKHFASIIKNDAGRTERIVGVTQDITEKMRHEHHLQNAKEMAESAARAKSSFLANMSHEIRTPINAIVGMNYLLDKTELNDRQKDYNNKIRLSSEQLLRIVTDILDFSKIEAGKLRLEAIPFNLRTVINNIHDIYSNQSSQKQLQFDIVIDQQIPNQLVGDPLRLGQILMNLVHNAIKFTEQGGIRLNVRLLRRKERSCRLQFSVTDSGIGLTESQIEELFNPFTQADSSTTRVYGGTGLGLTISQQLAQLMGGQILVESRINIGSNFSFELMYPIFSPDIPPSDAAGEEETFFNGTRILVVEDNIINQLLTKEILETSGAIVDVAENGKEACDILDKIGYDAFELILMDIQMPIMDGVTATKKIREKVGNDTLPIIALTADITEETKEKVKEIGMQDYISKPIDVKSMLTTIKELIK